MTVKGPKVRDFTEAGGSLQVEVESWPIYELLLELFVLDDEEEAENYEQGSGWVARVEARSSEELKQRLDELRPAGEIWLGLLGLAYETPEPKTLDNFIARLEDIGSEAVRSHFICASPSHGFGDVSEETIEAAAAGDDDAIAAVLPVNPEHPNKHRGVRTLLSMEPDASLAALIDTLRRYHDEVFTAHQRLEQILHRDVAAKQSMSATMPPERLVELATNGITFTMAPDVSAVVLIPSYVLRPWVIITEMGSKRIFYYSVEDEHITAEPGSPPNWLVQFYKALADERRLRILSLLAEGDANLGELTEQLDLAKSTTHHHLRILRAAGLVRVTLGSDKMYSLRRDAVPEASHLLESYLATAAASSQALEASG